MYNTIAKIFTSLFDRDQLLQIAKKMGAIRRLRDIHPQDFCAAVLACASGDEQRSIASARRKFQQLTDFIPEESSFYQHFNQGMVRLFREIFRKALDQSTLLQQKALQAALGGKGILDLLVFDASQVLLNKKAAAVLESTSEDHGGFKLSVTMSLLLQSIDRIFVTEARRHDIRALRLDRWLHNKLLLFDRGYFSAALFKKIVQRRGFFVTRMKKNVRPVIVKIRSGLGQKHVGEKWSLDLPFRQKVDMDVAINDGHSEPVVLRLVKTQTSAIRRGDKDVPVDAWLLTNLVPEDFLASDIGVLYRLRWSVEILFRQLKSVGRLDQLNSSNLSVILSFLFATLTAMLLSKEISTQMRLHNPKLEPSEQRVMTLLIQNFVQLIKALPGHNRKRCKKRTFVVFENALWREGINPNFGRKYMTNQYAERLSCAA